MWLYLTWATILFVLLYFCICDAVYVYKFRKIHKIRTILTFMTFLNFLEALIFYEPKETKFRDSWMGCDPYVFIKDILFVHYLGAIQYFWFVRVKFFSETFLSKGVCCYSSKCNCINLHNVMIMYIIFMSIAYTGNAIRDYFYIGNSKLIDDRCVFSYRVTWFQFFCCGVYSTTTLFFFFRFSYLIWEIKGLFSKLKDMKIATKLFWNYSKVYIFSGFVATFTDIILMGAVIWFGCNFFSLHFILLQDLFTA